MDPATFNLLLFPQTPREPGSTQLTCPLPAASPTVKVFNLQTGPVLGHDATALRRLPMKDFSGVFAGWSYILTPSFINTSLSMIKTIRHTHSPSEPGSASVNPWPLLWTSSTAVLELCWTRFLQQLRSSDSCPYM